MKGFALALVTAVNAGDYSLTRTQYTTPTVTTLIDTVTDHGCADTDTVGDGSGTIVSKCLKWDMALETVYDEDTGYEWL